jgi:hypothetical protein
MSAKKIAPVDEIVVESEEFEDAGQAPQQDGTGKESKTVTTKLNGAFDPTQYLSKFDGKDYLEVKWRLLWLRSAHPDARLTTEIV